MALIFAIVAAVLLGGSDFWAARAARTAPSITVTRSVVAVSSVLAPVLVLFVDSSFIARDLILGGLSGFAMTTGLALLYRGYAVARIGVVAPMSSVLLPAVPVVYDLVRGERPGVLGAAGMVIGLVALVLTSYQPGGDGSVSLGALLGITSGVAFGIAFTLMGEVSEASGLAPVVAQRWVGLGLLVAVFGFGSAPLLVSTRGERRAAVTAGIFGAIAIASLQLGFHNGASGPVSVAASQFATVVVIFSVLFNRERMRWWQGIGVAATAIGVAFLALSS